MTNICRLTLLLIDYCEGIGILQYFYETSTTGNTRGIELL